MKSVFTSSKFMEDPFSHIDNMREQGALVQIKLPIIGKVWVTTNQKTAGLILKDTRNFTLRKKSGRVTGLVWWMPKSIALLAQNMLTMDEPDHTRLRSLVDYAFRRDVMLELEPRIQLMANEMAQKLFSNAAQVDLIDNYARKLPLAVICEMIGIAKSDRAQFSSWANSLTKIEGMFDFLKAIRPIGKIRKYIAGEIARQRITPENGLLAELIEMQNDGAEISDDEMIAMVFLLLLAGHETTTHVISGGIYTLLQNPEQSKIMLQNEKSLNLGVEELLRFVSAVQFTKPRNVRSDIIIEGVAIKKGDIVMPMIVAANGDPDVIECPHTLKVDRKPNKHLSFGAGPHFCLGHQLARIEIACAVKTIFEHYPNLQLAVPQDQIKWRSRVGMRIIDKLSVRVN